jgi:hypothetical protein
MLVPISNEYTTNIVQASFDKIKKTRIYRKKSFIKIPITLNYIDI